MIKDKRPIMDKRILNIYTDIVSCAVEIGYIVGAEVPPLCWLEGSHRAYGKCVTCQEDDEIVVRRICLNVGFEHSPEEIVRTILTHEVAHLCAARKYGTDGCGHGRYFHEVGDRLGQACGVTVRTHDQFHTDPSFAKYLDSLGWKYYPKLFIISEGRMFIRAYARRNVVVPLGYVNSGTPYRRRWFFTDKESWDAKWREYFVSKDKPNG